MRVEEGASPASAGLRPGPDEKTSRDVPEGVGSGRILVSQPKTIGVVDRPECFQGVSAEVVLLRLVVKDGLKGRGGRCVFRAAEVADGIAAQWKAAVFDGSVRQWPDARPCEYEWIRQLVFSSVLGFREVLECRLLRSQRPLRASPDQANRDSHAADDDNHGPSLHCQSIPLPSVEQVIIQFLVIMKK